MIGHRRRLFLAFGGWAHELMCTSAAIVGPNYSLRARHNVRRTVRGKLRAWQKRQDRREASEA